MNKNNILKIIIVIYIIIFLKISYGYFSRYNNYLTGGDSRHTLLKKNSRVIISQY